MSISLNGLEKNYKLEREIGSGGMGEVFLAIDKRLERSVAIKFLKIDQDDNDINDSIIRFRREAIAIAKLSHPNIVNIFDIGEENNKHYMIMEFLDGNSLATILKKTGEKIAPHLIASIGIQICNALECAHENNIIHRDVKPENIILTNKGVVKLTDFGIAQLNKEHSTKLTQQGSILGSFIYLSPEQLKDSSNIDHRADIYSLGATLYELLAGKPAFQGENFVEVFMKIFHENPVIQSSQPGDLSDLLGIAILKAMAKEPANRFQSVKEMKEILLSIVSNEEGDSNNYSELSDLNTNPSPLVNITTTSSDPTEKIFRINNTLSNKMIESNRLKLIRTQNINREKPLTKFNNFSWLTELIGACKRESLTSGESKEAIYQILGEKEKFTGIIIFDENIYIFIYNNYLIGALNSEQNIVGDKAFESLPEFYKLCETRTFSGESHCQPLLIYSIISGGIEVYKSLQSSSTDFQDYLTNLNSEKEFTGYIICKVKPKKEKERDFTILHLEDEEVDQILFANSLKQRNLNYNYQAVTHISEARKLLNSKDFDLLILDYFLDYGNASDIFSEIKNIPTIVCTASNDPKIAVAAMKAGVIDYIFKDGDWEYIDKLHKAIENTLTLKQEDETELIYYYGFIQGKPEFVIGIDELNDTFEIVESDIFNLISSSDITMDVYKADFNLLESGFKYLLKDTVVLKKYKDEAQPTFQSIIEFKSITSELENSVKENTYLALELKKYSPLNFLGKKIDPEKIVKKSANYKFLEWLFFKYFFMLRISNNQKAFSYFYRGVPQVEKIEFFSYVKCPENTFSKFPIVLSSASDVLFLVDMGECSREELEKFIQEAIFAKKENRLLKGAFYISTQPFTEEVVRVFQKYTNALSDSMMDNLAKYKGVVRVSAGETFQLNLIEYQPMVNNYNLSYPSLF